MCIITSLFSSFSQWDIRGNPHGLLAAHPIAPFVSIHHVEAVDPLFPGLGTLESLKLFTKAMNTEPRSFLQRAVCYDAIQKLTFSVSLGYVVQVFPNIVLPRELERSEQTYVAWNRVNKRDEFDFDTRDVYRSVCKKPILFFLKDIKKDGNVTLSSYKRAKRTDDLKRKVFCFPRSPPLPYVNEIQISGTPLSENWHLVSSMSLLHCLYYILAYFHFGGTSKFIHFFTLIPQSFNFHFSLIPPVQGLLDFLFNFITFRSIKPTC